MSRVATICKQSKQRGNALVLLLLLKTWDGKEAPTVYDLAELAHISPRQAERDLQKLIDDGDAERAPDEVKGRGHVTRFRLKESTTHVSDKTPSDMTDFITEEISASHPSDIPETTTHLTDLSDSKSVTSDGTPVAPSKAETITSSTTGAKAPSARAKAQPELPDWLPVESWREWEEHRREIKKPLTALSVKKQIKKLDGYRARGMPPEHVIEEAITHGWRDFYPLKDESHEATQPGANGNGHGREKQTGRPHDAPRRGAQTDRTPPGGWGFKNSPGG